MPRKTEPSFELKLMIWDVASTVGKDKPTDIRNQLDYEIEKRRKAGSFFEDAPDVRTISRIVKEINKLDPEVVLAKLPAHTWKLRDDYESIRGLVKGKGKILEQSKIDSEQEQEPLPKVSISDIKQYDKRISAERDGGYSAPRQESVSRG